MYKKMIRLSITFVSCFLLTGCNSNKSAETPTNASTVEQSSATNDKQKTTDSDVTTPKTTSGDDNANFELAIKTYEKKYPNTAITSVEYQKDLAQYYYEVKGVDEETEYKLKIKDGTEEILSDRSEQLDQDERNGVKMNEDALDLKDLKSIGEIKDIVSKELPNSEFLSWELDKDLSITFFDVTAISEHHEVELKLNAQTGELLEKELDD